MTCSNCARLEKKIEELTTALIMKKTLQAHSLLDEGEEYRVIKVRKKKNASGFLVVEDDIR